MKILVVLNGLGIGGAENYTIALINEFVKQNHSVVLCVLSNDLALIDRLNCQVQVKIWPRKRKLDFEVISKIRYELKNNDYEIIISSYPIYIYLSTVFVNNYKKIIYPIHSTIPLRKRDYLLNFIMFRLKRKNEYFVTSIEAQTEYLVDKYKLCKNMFRQIYNGVEISKFTLVPKSFNKFEFLKSKGINPNNKIILMVAGFRVEKRHIDAIEAFCQLNRYEDNISLVCVGNNNYEGREHLQKVIDLKGEENIILLTASDAGNIIEYFWSADIFTLTSNKVETFAISSLEAMACGLPCVLTNIGGAKNYIIEDFNGYLCEPENIESISNSWRKALRNFNNSKRSLIRQFIIENFSIAKSVDEYIKLMKE